MDANPDDEDDLDFLEEEGYVKDNNSSSKKKTIMIKREITGKRLPVINHHHQMEGVDHDHDHDYDHDHEKKKAGIGGRKGQSSNSSTTSSAGSMKCCQADKCTAELSDAKQYHRRHKVCEYHSKAQVVIVGGIRQRFCQQCSRFHQVSEFDESKRSCRRRLAGHNERRRKSTVAETTTQGAAGEASGGGGGKGQTKEMVDDRGRIHINIQENSSTNFKHFQIR